MVLLGTGTPNADPERSGPAVAIVVGDKPYLIDMGPGIVRRASAAHLRGVDGLAVANLDIVFVTHLHSDHTLGFPDLLFSPWTLEREKPLRVFGPKGIKAMAEHVSAAWSVDVAVRIDGLEPANETGHQVVVTEIEAGIVYRDQRVTVEAIAVNHGGFKPAFGYKVVTPDKVIVISGDTAPSEALIKACDECDILLHEVYSDSGFVRREPAWQKYHSQFHTSASELAAIANQSKPKLLVLYHQLHWGTADDKLLREVQKHYSGRVVSGADLDVF